MRRPRRRLFCATGVVLLLVCIIRARYDFAVVVPAVAKAGPVCMNLFTRGVPFACLIPSSLVHRVAQRPDGSYCKRTAQGVADAGKITFTMSEFTWLIHMTSEPAVHRVYRLHMRLGTQAQTPGAGPVADLPGIATTAAAVGTVRGRHVRGSL